jgi:hypothetical protein
VREVFGRHRAYKLQPQDIEAIVAEITQETVEDYLADIEKAVIADFGGDALEEVLKIARADMRPFVTNSQRTQEYLREKFGRNMKDITASTRREVSKALNEGIALGEDYTGLAKILDTKFKHIGQVRKDIIATTEVGAAANFAIDEGYRQSGLVSKRRWVTTFLRSRDTHMELSGDERGMDEAFTVNSVDGIASAMYPGDFNVAAEDINCRCRTVAAKFTSKETTEDVTLRRDPVTGEITRDGKPVIPTTPEPIPVPKPVPVVPVRADPSYRNSLESDQFEKAPAHYRPDKYDLTYGTNVRGEALAAVEKKNAKYIAERDRLEAELAPLLKEEKRLWDMDVVDADQWNADLNIVGNARRVVENDLYVLNARNADKVASEFRVLVKPPKGKEIPRSDIKTDGRLSKKVTEGYKDELVEAYTLISDDVHLVAWKDIPVHLRTGSVDIKGMSATHRAEYRSWTREINLANDPDALLRKIATHELGHQLEYDVRDAYGNAVWQLRANKFLEDRRKASGNRAPVSLKKEFPDGQYEDWETAWRDKWADQGRDSGELYTGKVYPVKTEKWGGNGLPSTEIIPMGMERMARNAMVFARQDPEYFDFIIGLLHGK